MTRVSHIFTYPIKSCSANAAESAEVEVRGLRNDRRMALVDSNNKVMTGRDYPGILELSVLFDIHGCQIRFRDQTLAFNFAEFSPLITGVDLWAKEQHPAQFGSTHINSWISERLATSCRLAFMGEDCHRTLPQDVPSNYRGRENDRVSYADDFPLLLTSKESLDDLNSRLQQPVSMLNFRPNIVVEGLAAFEEEGYKSVTIGDCEFEIAQACPRCVFTTIDPETGVKDENQEPLRTLASYRKIKGYGVPFGVQMVPRKLGSISIGDLVTLR